MTLHDARTYAPQGSKGATKATVEMVVIPGGEFHMGSTLLESEGPIRTVDVDDFLLDTTPVTNASFAFFVEETGYVTTAEQSGGRGWRGAYTAERDQHPVVFVSWFDAKAFASWADKRLPTEAEWEKAARGGLRGKLFPWGDEAPDTDRAVFSRAKPGQATQFPGTENVASLRPNGYGLFDMAGQVWEWCQDWFGEYEVQRVSGRDPQGTSDGSYRVRRGGAWNVRESFRLRCANRGALPPLTFHANVGFRCARSIDLAR